jgi:hypothetical protein
MLNLLSHLPRIMSHMSLIGPPPGPHPRQSARFIGGCPFPFYLATGQLCILAACLACAAIIPTQNIRAIITPGGDR